MVKKRLADAFRLLMNDQFYSIFIRFDEHQRTSAYRLQLYDIIHETLLNSKIEWSNAYHYYHGYSYCLDGNWDEFVFFYRISENEFNYSTLKSLPVDLTICLFHFDELLTDRFLVEL